jgi:polyhydroxyalkanoate synthesis repressor PhaR
MKRRGRPPIYVVRGGASRIVKKYGNRRLYDTRTSRYINLDDLLDLFGADEDVRVVDAASGGDLTERTLHQALVAARQDFVPAPLLRACLRYRHGRSRTAFERHLAAAIDAFRRRAG